MFAVRSKVGDAPGETTSPSESPVSSSTVATLTGPSGAASGLLALSVCVCSRLLIILAVSVCDVWAPERSSFCLVLLPSETAPCLLLTRPLSTVNVYAPLSLAACWDVPLV